MKISVEEVSRLLSTPVQDRSSNPSTPTAAPARAPQTSPSAQVSVSAQAQEVQRVKRLIGQLPDVRADRVAALKAQVEAGTYHVSGEDIADLIIRRTLADSSAL